MTAESKPVSRRGLRKTVARTEEWIGGLRNEGPRAVEVTPETLAALRAPVPAAGPAAGSGMASVAEEIAACTRCPLSRARHRTVPGQGNPRAELMFIGEGPGAEEDRQGLAFIGPAGQLLTRMIIRMGFRREDVFIANIVKCRPTENFEGRRDRPPTPEEMATCIPYLKRQIELVAPRVLVALGGTALEGLLGLKGITRQRGTWGTFMNIPVMPTFHPSYLLRGGGDEKARYWTVWGDLVEVLKKLGREPPKKA